MWHPFSKNARQAISTAKTEAEKLENNYIGSEHILLGIIEHRDNAASKILLSLGIDLDKVKSKVMEKASWGRKTLSEDFTFTSRAKRVIDKAFEQSRKLSKNVIGTEHILLGLLEEAEGIAARTLIHDFDLKYQKFFNALKHSDTSDVIVHEKREKIDIKRILGHLNLVINSLIQLEQMEFSRQLQQIRDRVYRQLYLKRKEEEGIEAAPENEERIITAEILRSLDYTRKNLEQLQQNELGGEAAALKEKISSNLNIEGLEDIYEDLKDEVSELPEQSETDESPLEPEMFKSLEIPSPSEVFKETGADSFTNIPMRVSKNVLRETIREILVEEREYFRSILIQRGNTAFKRS